MARTVLIASAGVLVGVVLGAAVGLHAASDDIPEDTVAAAAEAGVDATDLLGAQITTQLGPREYLRAVGELPRVSPAPFARVASVGYQARVRLTYYVESGVTYGGGHTYPGSTACSWNFALGTRFVLPNGEAVTCNDRGLLGSAGWLDLFRRPDLARAYGPFATVQVIP